MSAPSDQITGDRFTDWLTDAGKDAASRTLKVQDKAAYNALVAKGLDDNWKIGPCKVLDKDGNEITE